MSEIQTHIENQIYCPSEKLSSPYLSEHEKSEPARRKENVFVSISKMLKNSVMKLEIENRSLSIIIFPLFSYKILRLRGICYMKKKMCYSNSKICLYHVLL